MDNRLRTQSRGYKLGLAQLDGYLTPSLRRRGVTTVGQDKRIPKSGRRYPSDTTRTVRLPILAPLPLQNLSRAREGVGA